MLVPNRRSLYWVEYGKNPWTIWDARNDQTTKQQQNTTTIKKKTQQPSNSQILCPASNTTDYCLGFYRCVTSNYFYHHCCYQIYLQYSVICDNELYCLLAGMDSGLCKWGGLSAITTAPKLSLTDEIASAKYGLRSVE